MKLLQRKSVCWMLVAWAGLVAAATSNNPRFWLESGQETSPSMYTGTRTLESRAEPSKLSLEDAKKIVSEAIAKSSDLNKARMENPVRNRYTVDASGNNVKRSSPMPLMDVTPDIAAAAAMVAEDDAANQQTTGNYSDYTTASAGVSLGAGVVESQAQAATSEFWMESLKRMGTSPWGGDSNYTVFRNVKDYGAKGDGKTDDTAAIQRAISDGKRCGAKCSGSTTRNAIVYLPTGSYLVSSPIILYFGTQFIGNANNWPTITAAPSFVGLGVLTTDVYDGANGSDSQWYVNTANFYRQIRNMYVDVSRTSAGASNCAIHYQVAQATSLQNVQLIAKAGTTQRGMFTENGSGGVLADVVFTGGQYGIYGGNQQFTAQRLTFQGCDTAVRVIWDWGWMWKSINVFNSGVGFSLVKDAGSSGSSGSFIGSAAVIDSVFINVQKAFVIAPPSATPGSGTAGIVLDNVAFQNVSSGVVDTSGKTWLAGGSGGQSWVLGPVYNGTRNKRVWNTGQKVDQYRDISLLGTKTSSNAILVQDPYFERAKPQYETSSTSDFVHLKDLGAKGDGKTDDTAAVQAALDKYVNSKIIFADAGVYLLTDTVTIPPGTRLVGEAWAQFAATGKKFSNVSASHVMLQVGKQNDTGSVEIQDLIFTTKGPTPGAILVQWNIQADKPGQAGMWDCHARLGGATGTQLTTKECAAPATGPPKTDCMAASLVLHITPDACGYFENMWLWTADHMIDDADLTSGTNPMPLLAVYTARGVLVESQRATWLYGTASEHAILYQYNFFGAASIFAGMLQTEPPYFQPSPKPPSPYIDDFDYDEADPVYDTCDTNTTATLLEGCDAAWGLMVQMSQDIYIASAGVYSFFKNYKQDCISTQSCQQASVYLTSNFHRVRIQQLITIGAKTSIVDDGGSILAADNLAVKEQPQWSQITVYDAVEQGGSQALVTLTDLAVCDSSDKWATLDDLYNDIETLPENCVSLYALPIMYRMLSGALANYTKMNSSSDYDHKFNSYVGWVKEQTPVQLDSFMAFKTGSGGKYFSCIAEVDNKNKTTSCTQQENFSKYYTMYYTLVDHDGFFNELQNDTGILPDWVNFGEQIHEGLCNPRGDVPCDPYIHKYEGFPIPSKNYTVDNPKHIIDGAGQGFNTTLVTIAGYILQIQAGEYTGLNSDVMQVLIMPVSMAVQAVESMEQVMAIGKKVEEEKKKEIILLVLSLVFLVIPFVGEVIGPELGVTVAALGRIISVVGMVGNGALSLYDIYADPSSAPLAILGLLMGVGGSLGRSAEDMTKAASLRRGMKDTDLVKMGTVFKANDGLVQKMAAFCKKT